MNPTLRRRLGVPTTLIGIILALILPSLLLLNLEGLPDRRWQVPSAQLMLGRPGASPAELANSAPTPASLPDPWHLRRPGVTASGLYRITFDVDQVTVQEHSLLVPRASLLRQVSLNGNSIWRAPTPHAPQDANFHRALFLQFPTDLLRSGANELSLFLDGEAGVRGGLSEVFIGPRSELERYQRLRALLQEQLVLVANLLVLGLSIPLFAIWFFDPRASHYGMFAFGTVLFAGRNFYIWIENPPVPAHLWRALIDITIGWSVAILAFFCFRFTGYKNRWLERFLIGFVLAGSALLLATAGGAGVRLETFTWRLPMLLLTLFCILLFITRTIMNPTAGRLLLVYGFASQVVPAIHDMMWRFDLNSFSTVRWLPLTFPALLILMALVLAHEFVDARMDLQKANARLDRRVAEVSRELEVTYEQKRALDAELAGSHERQRLIRDMHDGVGSQLSLLLSGLNQGQLSIDQAKEAIELSLDDLRLIIDARSQSTHTLLDALANYRYRSDARLSALGVTTKWQIGEGAEAIALAPDATLHVLRIVQECVSNAIRHGRASVLAFSLRAQKPAATGPGGELQGFVLEITDNGVGPERANEDTAGTHKGMGNLKARAAALGGEFDLLNTPDGTVARLVVARG